MLAVLMGGRSARQEFSPATITTGAPGNDIERATDIRAQYGLRMGHERVGTAGLPARKMRLSSWAAKIDPAPHYSEEHRHQIEQGSEAHVNGGYEKAKHLLAKNRDTSRRIAQALLERKS